MIQEHKGRAVLFGDMVPLNETLNELGFNSETWPQAAIEADPHFVEENSLYCIFRNPLSQLYVVVSKGMTAKSMADVVVEIRCENGFGEQAKFKHFDVLVATWHSPEVLKEALDDASTFDIV